MSVRPAKDKKGNLKPGEYDVDFYPASGRRTILRMAFRSEADAYAFERELRRKSREPVAPVNPRVNELLPEFCADYENNHLPNSFRDLNYALVHLVPFFGGMYLASLSPALVEQYKRQRLETPIAYRGKGDPPEGWEPKYPTRRTINKELCYLSAFLTWSAENGHYSGNLKIKKFPAKQTRAAKPRIPHRSEVEKMIAAIEPQYRLPLLLMYDAGLRRDEALSLKVEDVQLKAGLLMVLGKGNKERIVPITTDRLRDELKKAVKERKTGYLSVNPKTKEPWYSIRKALMRAATAAGIEGRVYHHLLRHSFGTHSLEAGVNLRALQGFMGHSTSQVTETYTHLLQDYLLTEAQKINRAAQKTTRQAGQKAAKELKLKKKPVQTKN